MYSVRNWFDYSDSKLNERETCRDDGLWKNYSGKDSLTINSLFILWLVSTCDCLSFGVLGKILVYLSNLKKNEGEERKGMLHNATKTSIPFEVHPQLTAIQHGRRVGALIDDDPNY
jgi:hypothetical protein